MMRMDCRSPLMPEVVAVRILGHQSNSDFQALLSSESSGNSKLGTTAGRSTRVSVVRLLAGEKQKSYFHPSASCSRTQDNSTLGPPWCPEWGPSDHGTLPVGLPVQASLCRGGRVTGHLFWLRMSCAVNTSPPYRPYCLTTLLVTPGYSPFPK